MSKTMYVIRDVKASCWFTPFFSVNEASAIRSIHMHMDQGESALTQFPEDYELYEVGTFDENNGEMYLLEHKKYIISLHSIFLNVLKNAQLRQRLGDAKLLDESNAERENKGSSQVENKSN